MIYGLTFTSERTISSAFIDSSVKLGIAQAVLLIQDNLTECFGALGCDGVVYREQYNAFWVFTKTKVQFARRPAWRETVTACTFPVDNAGMRTHVNTVISAADGTPLITANQEACVLSLENHRPLKLSSLTYPSSGFPEAICTAPFERFSQDFSDADFQFEQVIRSQHIDMSHHMNNIEYIKLALSTFNDDWLQSHEIADLEVHYTGESREGDTLRVFRTDADGATFVRLLARERCVFELKAVFR